MNGGNVRFSVLDDASSENPSLPDTEIIKKVRYRVQLIE
jgi:hypothetical protein